MKSINELGLDLEKVEVRKKVVNALLGANVEFEYSGLDSIDCRGKIIGYRNEIGRPDFYIIILAVWDDFPFGWRQLDEFDTVIYGEYSERKKAFIHIPYIQIPDILADALVGFVKSKTIPEPEVSNDLRVSKSYLSNSNGFKY